MVATLQAPDNRRGAAWMLVSVVGAVGMTLFVRELTPHMHSSMIAFARSALGLVFLAPLFLRAQPVRLRGLQAPGLHLLRGALIALALNLGYYAIWKLPLATATILFFAAPVFATMLAPAVLGERVGPWRWSAVAAGFLGAAIVLRPSAGALDPAMLAALGSALCFGLALLLGKRAGVADGPDAVFATTALATLALTAPGAALTWAWPPDAGVWALVALLSAASALRSYADIRAVAAGEASVVTPITYLRLPALAFAGWALYGETVDALTWLGGGVIVAATLTIAVRERRRPAAAPPSLGG